MVVDDFDIARSSVLPDETDTPLIIDPYAVLPLAPALEGFEPIAGRHTHIL